MRHVGRDELTAGEQKITTGPDWASKTASDILQPYFIASAVSFEESGVGAETALGRDIAVALRKARQLTIDECIKQLGGRYGAAARKDLSMLKRFP